MVPNLVHAHPDCRPGLARLVFGREGGLALTCPLPRDKKEGLLASLAGRDIHFVELAAQGPGEINLAQWKPLGFGCNAKLDPM